MLPSRRPILIVLVSVAVALIAPDVRSEDDTPTTATLKKLLGDELEILETLEALDLSITSLGKEMVAMEAKKVQAAEELAQASADLEEFKDKLGKQKGFMKKRLQVLLSLGKLHQVPLAFSSEGYFKLLKQEHFLEKLAEVDKQFLISYKKNVFLLEAKFQKLAELETTYANLLDSMKKTAATLEIEKKSRIELLARVKKKKQYFIKAGVELDEACKALTDKLATIDQWSEKQMSLSKLKGTLRYPILPGKVAVPFGTIVDPTFKTETVHRGWDILPTKLESGKKYNVRAVFWGKVVFAGWLRGYGNTVILDHTQGYHTVYAHLDEITVAKGDILKSRNTLGYMGSSGSLKGAYLYFELRKDTKPINPAPFFK